MLCKERVGACIQCSVKTCKTAYHVTCAFKKGLEMRAIIEDENAEDGVKLRVSGVEKVFATLCFVWVFSEEIPVTGSQHVWRILHSFYSSSLSVVLSKTQSESKEAGLGRF